jgi:DNA replication protein DnaC
MKVQARSRREQIRTMLADLKLPGSLEAVDEVLRDADGGTLTAAEAIERLLGAQITLRNNRRLQTAMRASRLPAVKTLADFDFSFQPSIKREQIESLHELGFVERNENVVLLGPPGVGKTHLAVSLAIAAAQGGRRVYYGTLAELITSLEEAQAAGRLARRLATLTYPSLLVVDEIGYLPVTRTGAVLFFQLHRPPLRARVHRAHVQQKLRGMGRGLGRRSHGRGTDRPRLAPLPSRQHPRQQLPHARARRSMAEPRSSRRRAGYLPTSSAPGGRSAVECAIFNRHECAIFSRR